MTTLRRVFGIGKFRNSSAIIAVSALRAFLNAEIAMDAEKWR